MRQAQALANRRADLLAACHAQRQEVYQHSQTLKPWLAWTDLGLSTWRLVRHQHWLFASNSPRFSQRSVAAVRQLISYINHVWKAGRDWAWLFRGS